MRVAWLVVALGCCVSGCAYIEDRITIEYVPQAGVAKLDGADAVTVTLAIQDIRAIKDKVGAKESGMSAKPTAIIAEGDIPETVRAACEVELVHRGFRVGEGGVPTVLVLRKFYSWWTDGFLWAHTLGELTMHVQIKDTDGVSVFSKFVKGEGVELAFFQTGGNAKDALEMALSDAVSHLFNDPAFIDALLKRARTPATESPPQAPQQ